jgi:hypothetical protein
MIIFGVEKSVKFLRLHFINVYILRVSADRRFNSPRGPILLYGQQQRRCIYNVTLGRVPATIVAVENQ